MLSARNPKHAELLDEVVAEGVPPPLAVAQTGRLPATPAHHRVSFSERRVALAAFDIVSVGLAWVLAFNLYTAEVRGAFPYVPRRSTLVAVALWLACASLAGAYDLRAAMTMRGALRQVLGAIGLTTLALLGAFFVDPFLITRPTVILWVPLALITVMTARALFRRLLLTRALAGSVALVMEGDTLEKVWPEVRREIGNLYRVVARVDPTRAGSGEQLVGLIAPRGIDQVIVGVRDNVPRDVFASLVLCYQRGIRVRSLADLYEELTGRLLLDQLGDSWLMSIPMRGDTSRLYAAFKRGSDIAAGLLGLVAMLAVLPLAVIGNLLAVRGPLFFRQERVGKYGRTFRVWKFRTMRVDAGGPATWTTHGDARITPFGRVLRRTHLDELPQAINMLRGDMSLIGPRPEQPHYVEQLSEQLDYYRTRLTIRPGLTGWAQVHHGYGSGVEGTRIKLSYDLYYIKRQSVSLDLAVIVRTVVAVFSLGGR